MYGILREESKFDSFLHFFIHTLKKYNLIEIAGKHV